MKMITMLVSALALAACGGAPEGPEGMGAPSSSSSSSASSAGSPDDAGSPAPSSSSSSSSMSAPTSSDDDAGATAEAAAVVIDAGAPPQSYTPDAACHDLACEGNAGPPSDASPYVTTCLNQEDGCDGCVNLSATGCTSSGGTIGTNPVYACPIGTVCYPGTLNRGGAGNTVSCTFSNICPM
jgi:hypothetical protein